MRQILIADAVVDREHPVLFRQGDLDGACGLYALMMGLNLCGYVDDETSFAHEPDRRTQLGRLYKQFEDYPALFSGGSYIEDLKEVLDKAYGRKIKTEFHEGNNKSIIRFTVSHLSDGHPVILGIRARGGVAHAVLACGLEFEQATCASAKKTGELPKPQRILILDPGGYEAPSFIHWNSFIYPEPQFSGSYPYQFVDGICGVHKVSFDEALALWSMA